MGLDALVLKAVEAKNLAPMDKGGTSDPYLRIKCSFNKQHFKTSVVDKTLSPTWNEQFKFFAPLPEGSILIKVWDKDRWSSDDFLGEVSLRISDFEVGKEVDEWYTLSGEPKKKKEPKPGSIRLVLKLEGEEKKKKSSKKSANGETSSTSSDDSSGKMEDKYKIGSELGRGGFSVVKEAKRKSDNVMFAVKCINKKNVNDDELVLLGREIEIMQKLTHDHIVQLVDIYDTDHDLYLILELVKGGELFDKIVEKGSYSEKDAANLISQILSAVDYMHQNGVAHRDLKPENLLIGGKNEDEVKIADFGLSKDFGQSHLQTSCGTPGYVAPEVLMGEPYDNGVDIWSIGVITYVLLCGFTPFYGDNQRELFDQIINADYTFPDPEWTEISKEAKDFIKKILVTNPAKRLTAKEALSHPWIVDKAPSKQLASLTSFRNLLSDTTAKDKKNRTVS